jgi:hypothetical protein
MTNATIRLAWWVMFPTAEPTATWLPLRMSGISAERAEENGAPSSTVPNSSVHNAQNGVPVTAISPTVTTRTRSQAIITCRRGNRSASPDSNGPPTIGGR